MPSSSRLCPSKTSLKREASKSLTILDFLAPSTYPRYLPRAQAFHTRVSVADYGQDAKEHERHFFSILSEATACRQQSRPFHQSRKRHEGRREAKKTRAPNPELLRSQETNSVLKSDVKVQRKHIWHNTDSRSSFKPAAKPLAFFRQNFPRQWSHLPQDFYDDVVRLHDTTEWIEHEDEKPRAAPRSSAEEFLPTVHENSIGGISDSENGQTRSSARQHQQSMLTAVRRLESNLARAKKRLIKMLAQPQQIAIASGNDVTNSLHHPTIVLTKDDYLNLVDLYFYTHTSRFGPESPDFSPTPTFIEEPSLTRSADLTPANHQDQGSEVERTSITSSLKEVGDLLKSSQLRSLSLLRTFVDLLLDDSSSDWELFDAYKMLPKPGVSHLPQGVIRLFLQRMSTPRVKSSKAKLRYLHLIDEMQKANVPITKAEWSSAIYLAGRSFSKVHEHDVTQAWRLWEAMEQEAGVQASHVTFNILFDIAIRAGKYLLGELVLRKMHQRGLRLNRLGRVSLIYYFGLKADGDGVRKAYRDFVEAGEIVDTLVMNCVIASLIRAQEPVAAEQVYERMKNLQAGLRAGQQHEVGEPLYQRYPPPGSTEIERQVASDHLGRVLQRAPNLRKVLPEAHTALQDSMPLKPDQMTFRPMITYHATTSGNLDRLTVLLNDKMQLFGLSLTSLDYRLFFKGFALHGHPPSEDNPWTIERLDLVRQSCFEDIKERNKASRRPKIDSIVDPPTTEAVNAEMKEEAKNRKLHGVASMGSQNDSLSGWKDPKKHTDSRPLRSSVSQQEPNASEQSNEDEIEGFPSPFFSPDENNNNNNVSIHPEEAADDKDAESPHTHRVRAEALMIIWLLRAYQRNTSSRRRMEEIWAQVIQVWRPRDERERDFVATELKRALRKCDYTVTATRYGEEG